MKCNKKCNLINLKKLLYVKTIKSTHLFATELIEKKLTQENNYRYCNDCVCDSYVGNNCVENHNGIDSHIICDAFSNDAFDKKKSVLCDSAVLNSNNLSLDNIIFSFNQTNGIGSRSRCWESLQDNIYCSIIVSSLDIKHISLVMAVGVLNGLKFVDYMMNNPSEFVNFFVNNLSVETIEKDFDEFLNESCDFLNCNSDCNGVTKRSGQVLFNDDIGNVKFSDLKNKNSQRANSPTTNVPNSTTTNTQNANYNTQMNIRDNLFIKWPNDIYYRDKKICGILINNFHRDNNIANINSSINNFNGMCVHLHKKVEQVVKTYSILSFGINVFSSPSNVDKAGYLFQDDAKFEKINECIEQYQNKNKMPYNNNEINNNNKIHQTNNQMPPRNNQLQFTQAQFDKIIYKLKNTNLGLNQINIKFNKEKCMKNIVIIIANAINNCYHKYMSDPNWIIKKYNENAFQGNVKIRHNDSEYLFCGLNKEFLACVKNIKTGKMEFINTNDIFAL